MNTEKNKGSKRYCYNCKCVLGDNDGYDTCDGCERFDRGETNDEIKSLIKEAIKEVQK